MLSHGGYVHSSYVYTDEVLENIDSYDFTSSYPYCLVTHKFPMTKFVKGNLKDVNNMLYSFAWLLKVKLTNVDCKYRNNFISKSKCEYIVGGKYDNGRIMSAKELVITLTDVDLRLYKLCYKFDCEILESYYSMYDYLPKELIEFILDKYVSKTMLKGVEGKEIEYQKEKNKFNSIYGMCVTNTIRDEVSFKNGEWFETEITNDEIIKKLKDEESKGFLSFAWGVWCTAYARNNLIKNIIKQDDFLVYSDTDSMKLLEGYDKDAIDEYNSFVERKIDIVSKRLKISRDAFAPLGRTLGVFDYDDHYDEFITQGAKKYAYKKNGKIGITVAGVPKKGSMGLKDLNDFRDNFVFEHKITGKNTICYLDNQDEFLLEDYQGVKYLVTDKSGICVLPTTYILGKALEYVDLLTDASSERARYKE